MVLNTTFATKVASGCRACAHIRLRHARRRPVVHVRRATAIAARNANIGAAHIRCQNTTKNWQPHEGVRDGPWRDEKSLYTRATIAYISLREFGESAAQKYHARSSARWKAPKSRRGFSANSQLRRFPFVRAGRVPLRRRRERDFGTKRKLLYVMYRAGKARDEHEGSDAKSSSKPS